jgi:hypothetical protein
MAKSSEREFTVVSLTATKDKETKGTYRFLIDENDEGISGSLYLRKDEHDLKKVSSIKLKVRV